MERVEKKGPGESDFSRRTDKRKIALLPRILRAGARCARKLGNHEGDSDGKYKRVLEEFTLTYRSKVEFVQGFWWL